MKKSILGVLSVITLTGAVTATASACGKEAEANVQLAFSSETYTVNLYEETLLELNKSGIVMWTVSDPAILTIEDGKAVGLKEGTVTVTAMIGEEIAECTVTVATSVISGYTLTADAEIIRLAAGNSCEIGYSAKVLNNDVVPTKVFAQTDDETIATAKVENGKIVVEAVKKGNTTLKISAWYQGAVNEIVIPVEVSLNGGIELVSDFVTLTLADTETTFKTLQLCPVLKINGQEIENAAFTYVSGKASVVSVSENGLLTAKSVGNAKITVSTIYREEEIHTEISVAVTRANVELENKYIYDTEKTGYLNFAELGIAAEEVIAVTDEEGNNLVEIDADTEEVILTDGKATFDMTVETIQEASQNYFLIFIVTADTEYSLQVCFIKNPQITLSRSSVYAEKEEEIEVIAYLNKVALTNGYEIEVNDENVATAHVNDEGTIIIKGVGDGVTVLTVSMLDLTLETEIVVGTSMHRQGLESNLDYSAYLSDPSAFAGEKISDLAEVSNMENVYKVSFDIYFDEEFNGAMEMRGRYNSEAEGDTDYIVYRYYNYNYPANPAVDETWWKASPDSGNLKLSYYYIHNNTISYMQTHAATNFQVEGIGFVNGDKKIETGRWYHVTYDVSNACVADTLEFVLMGYTGNYRLRGVTLGGDFPPENLPEDATYCGMTKSYDVLTNVQAKTHESKYVAFEICLLNDIDSVGTSDGNNIYLLVGDRHCIINKWGLQIISLDGTWQNDYSNIPADFFRVYDENGELVNDVVRLGVREESGEYKAVSNSVSNNLETDKWYTVVINLNGKYTSDWSGSGVNLRNEGVTTFMIRNVDKEWTEPPSVSFAETSCTVAAYTKITLTPDVENWNGEIVWTSSDETVATVDEKGVVTALKEGHVKVTATAGTASAYCLITVTPAQTTIAVSSEYVYVSLNQTVDFTYEIFNYDDSAEIDYDNSVISLGDGKITGLTVGETTITIKAGTVEKQVKVTVLEGTKYSGTSDVDALTYSGNAFSYHGVTIPTLIGGTTNALESIEFDIYFTGDITAMYMEITCENTGAAGFIAGNRYYNYNAIATGSPTWQANSNGSETNGRYLYLSYNAQNGGNYNNYGKQLQYLIIEGIDTENNLTSAMTSGNWYHVTYMFTRTDMDYSIAEFKVLGYSGDYYVKNVGSTKKPAKITLDKETATIDAGDTLTLTATKENTESAVVWTSSDEAVATVDENGVVTALGAGQTTITATVDGIEAKCVVTVTVFSIDNGRDVTLLQGETHTIAVTANNAEETVSFTSDAEAVATVDENGVVTAVGAGKAKITVSFSGNTGYVYITVASSKVDGSVALAGSNISYITPKGVTQTVRFSFTVNNSMNGLKFGMAETTWGGRSALSLSFGTGSAGNCATLTDYCILNAEGVFKIYHNGEECDPNTLVLEQGETYVIEYTLDSTSNHLYFTADNGATGNWTGAGNLLDYVTFGDFYSL